MSNDTTTILREIKQSFRLLMNGVTAQSMRDKGLDYHVNWGANLLHLREMAAEYKPDSQLAQALWKEDVRECKILATMLMPPAAFTQEEAMQWIGMTHSQEIAEIACMNLYQHLPYSATMAQQLAASDNTMLRLHGFNILSRLFTKAAGGDCDGVAAQGLGEITQLPGTFVACASDALKASSLPLRHAAYNALQRFADISEDHRAEAETALQAV